MPPTAPKNPPSPGARGNAVRAATAPRKPPKVADAIRPETQIAIDLAISSPASVCLYKLVASRTNAIRAPRINSSSWRVRKDCGLRRWPYNGSMQDPPTSDFLQGAAMMLAQLCRRGNVDAARRVAADVNLDYGAFVRAGVDEADLEELRAVFDVPARSGDVVPFRSSR